MYNYAVWFISLVAALTGVTLPQALVGDPYYSVSSYTSENEPEVEILPQVQPPVVTEPHVAQQAVADSTTATDETVSPKSLPAVEFITQPQKHNDDAGPLLDSRAAIVIDDTTGAVLWQKNETAQLPIASITKLMTSLVVLDHTDNWDETFIMGNAENSLIGANFPSSNGDSYTKEDLLNTALIASANSAAAAVAHSTGFSEEEFVQRMNDKADQLGMSDSFFVEPTGLEEGNTSTVKDVAVLMRTVSRFPTLFDPTGKKEHRFKQKIVTEVVPEPTEEVSQVAPDVLAEEQLEEVGGELRVTSTNRLINDDHPYVIGGKTGFTYEAGYCLTTVSENEDGHRIIVVTLGAEDRDTRFEENAELIDWTYNNYTW